MAKAIMIRELGGPEVLRWEDVAVGRPGPGQVRLRHTAIGLNFIDTYHRTGLYPAELPTVLHTSSPSLESISTRVMADVPASPSRIRTL